MAFKREKVIRTAEKLVAKGKLENAIKEYRKVLAENPNDANTLNRVGDLYARIERFDEAVKLFSQIAEQYTQDGFFVKAIAIFKKIIKLSPQSLQVYERLAELYHKQGLLNEARTQYQILADHYEKRDNATSATTIYQRMSELEPRNPSYYLKLAQLYEAQHFSDKAIRAYRQLADLFLVNGSIDEATQVYLSALDSHAGQLDFVRDVVRDLHGEGHVEAAKAVMAKAAAVNPEAAAIEQEIFGAAEPPPVEAEAPAAVEEPADVDVSFDDSAFELPEVPDISAEPQAAPVEALSLETPAEAPPAPTPASAGFSSSLDEGDDDDSVFTLDLDNDEPLATQVMPPPDMMTAGGGEDFDVEIEGVEEPGGHLASAELFDDQEAPEEIDWSIDESPVAEEDGVELDVELDAEEIELGAEEIEIELETDETASVDPVPAQAGPAQPVPAQAGPAQPVPAQTLARHDDDLLAEAKVFAKYGLREKSQDRLRELLDANPEHLAGLSMMAQIDLDDGRHGEALERARTVARIATETASPEPWVELRQALEKAGLSIGEGEVAMPEVAPAPAQTEPQGGDRFARLLEDLDETATGLTVVPDGEPVEAVALEPESAGAPPETASLELEEPAEMSAEIEEDLITLDLEPLASEPLESEELEVEPAESAPEQVSSPPPPQVGQQTVSFDQSFFDLEDQIFDEEPVEADSPAPAMPEADPSPQSEESQSEESQPEESQPEASRPEAASSASGAEQAEPFAEIEALMQSVTSQSGFEELVPEETSLEELMPFDDSADSTAPAAAAPAAGNETGKVSLADELDLADLEDSAPESADPASDLDETGMSWLDDVAPPAAESAGNKDSIFDDEDDFFDLAAELEAEMSDGDDNVELETAQEQSLEEIIDGFKRGVADNLSSEDYDTHYNLGIAYREMGLLDEAIGEFQLASKDPRYIVDCSSMLGICFLDKGLPELAVRWYKKGLESPVVNEEQALGLLYDMGIAYVAQGDTDSAYRTFVEIYGMNSNYRDVAQQIQELQQATAPG